MIPRHYFYSRLYTKASEYLFHATKETAFVRIAKAIVDKIDEFPQVNIEELALAAMTSATSVTRFCYLLNYSSFYQLRHDIQPYGYARQFGEAESEEETIREIYHFLPFKECLAMAELLSNKKVFWYWLMNLPLPFPAC